MIYLVLYQVLLFCPVSSLWGTDLLGVIPIRIPITPVMIQWWGSAMPIPDSVLSLWRPVVLAAFSLRCGFSFRKEQFYRHLGQTGSDTCLPEVVSIWLSWPCRAFRANVFSFLWKKSPLAEGILVHSSHGSSVMFSHVALSIIALLQDLNGFSLLLEYRPKSLHVLPPATYTP